MPELTAELMPVLLALIILVGGVAGAAILTWFERRLLGVWQDRYGPNRTRPLGASARSSADMIKLLLKDDWVPPFADRHGVYFCADGDCGRNDDGLCRGPFCA